MKDYALIFRMDILTDEVQPNSEQLEKYMLSWNEWIGGIDGTGKLAGGNHFLRKGKLIRPGNNITDGPYAVNQESIAGYILIFAENIDDAVQIAKKCPILEGKGTSVEIREIGNPGDMN